MVRLVAFLLVIGLALYTVARIMAVLRGDSKQLPGPDEASNEEPESDASDSSDSTDNKPNDKPNDSDDDTRS